MIVADPGGANAFDTSTIGHRATLPDAWDDPVEYVTYEEQVPGRIDSVELADPDAVPRELRVVGWMSADDDTALQANLQTILQQFRPAGSPDDREISFPDDPDIIGVGRLVSADLQRFRPYFTQRAADVILRIRMRDPRRFDISGGRPGTALP